MNPDRIAQTEIAYLERYRRLCQRFGRETGKTVAEDPERFVDWLASLKPSLRAASWRQYRAASVFALRQSGYAEAAWHLEAIGTDGCKPPPRRRDRERAPPSGSERKYKRLPPKAYRRLLQYLRDRDGIWDRIVVLWLEAGRLTGLRPCEWREAKLVEEGASPCLVVQNAKATNGRAHGATRTLDLGGLTVEELAVVRAQLHTAHRHRDDWQAFYAMVRLALNRANRALWPGTGKCRITLYSARHQFIADAKKAGLTTAEIAALAGHATTDTAQVHYGRRKAGWKGRGRFRVSARPDEIARVRGEFTNNPKKGGFSQTRRP